MLAGVSLLPAPLPLWSLVCGSCDISLVRLQPWQGVSVGYNSTGKKVSASRMEPYGQAFGPSDRITVLVDLTGEVTGGSAAAGAGACARAQVAADEHMHSMPLDAEGVLEHVGWEQGHRLEATPWCMGCPEPERRERARKLAHT